MGAGRWRQWVAAETRERDWTEKQREREREREGDERQTSGSRWERWRRVREGCGRKSKEYRNKVKFQV